MVPDFALADHWPWITAAVAVLGDLALFLLARGPVALRPPRIGVLLLLADGARGVFDSCLGWPLHGVGEGVVAGTVLIGAIGLMSLSRTLVLKATQDGLKEQLETACDGLFLKWEEGPPGKYRLTAKGEDATVDTWPLSRSVQLVRLPRAKSAHRKSCCWCSGCRNSTRDPCRGSASP